MTNVRVTDAFSAGIGLAMGFAMTRCMFQALEPTGKAAKQIIVCLSCRGKNPVENRFCGHCGKPLYPPPKVQCPKCGVSMPSSMKFCGNCGSKLKE